MSHTIYLYWSFRSPYSYLAMPKLMALKEQYDVEIVVRPVFPIAIRKADFFEKVDPQWIPYLVRDCKRIADMQGIPFVWPNPDPIVQDIETRKISTEQPYIFRLTNLGIAASRKGLGLEFLNEVSHLIFSGTADWDKSDHLMDAAARTGLDLVVLEQEIVADKENIEAEIELNQNAQKEAGHWGVPLMVYNDEPFFGQDRIDVLIWRMTQEGLKKRGV